MSTSHNVIEILSNSNNDTRRNDEPKGKRRRKGPVVSNSSNNSDYRRRERQRKGKAPVKRANTPRAKPRQTPQANSQKMAELLASLFTGGGTGGGTGGTNWIGQTRSVTGDGMHTASLPVGFTLYRSKPNANVATAMENFQRGYYYGPKKCASIYCSPSTMHMTVLVQPVQLIIVDAHNMQVLVDHLKRLASTVLYFRDGTKLTAAECQKVVSRVTGFGLTSLRSGRCYYTNKPADEIRMCTDGFDFVRNKYNALVFAGIVCWFGYDGYTCVGQFRATHPPIPFHSEAFICNPLVVSQPLRLLG